MTKATEPRSGTRPGLFDGLHGAAFALGSLGYRQDALDVLDIALRENWETLGPDLGGGLAGIGLNLLHFAEESGESELRAAGLRASGLVAEQLGDEPDDEAPVVSGGELPYAGLMRGRSGQALLLLRAYDDTGDSGFLDRAAVALRQDLRRCVVRGNGSLEVNEGWRSMPYLGTGSTGIGLVLDEYLARRHDDQFAEASRGIELAARSKMYILPGLFNGRAGILYYRARRSASPVADPEMATQIRNLAWHALPYVGGLAFPGNEMLRLSMDLATGTAGVLLALGAALHDRPVTIPLLSPARKATPQTPAPTGAGQ
ncbi:lanthionine synthetase C family protein [Amycolatopsis sp. EV170708-02-1]|uniref:lanthionine synthetase C family protein n=1 Tax=Amycolatopsis sp. EV170708-02-1 TaxID=2919322 RepID=UPI001F0C4EE7|nr:lanthionine synthetase C family protein [Amycolatopsis sp. EV170708-02-1]UMP06772.1 lanthionine synthetase C family protein [Amycolatopsis sp. EV170708-02-1]